MKGLSPPITHNHDVSKQVTTAAGATAAAAGSKVADIVERKSLRKGAHVTPLLAETAGGHSPPSLPSFTSQPDWQAQSLFMLLKAPPATAPLAHSWLAKLLPICSVSSAGTGELHILVVHHDDANNDTKKPKCASKDLDNQHLDKELRPLGITKRTATA